MATNPDSLQCISSTSGPRFHIVLLTPLNDIYMEAHPQSTVVESNVNQHIRHLDFFFFSYEYITKVCVIQRLLSVPKIDIVLLYL
jgi:hypothetical protein